MKSIRTARLYFRPLRTGDEGYLFPEIHEGITEHWIGWEPPETIEEARSAVIKSINACKKGRAVELIAFSRQEDEFIGCVGISHTTDWGEFEINLWVKTSAQKQGYGREMCDMMIEWARQNVDLDYIVYSVTDGNVVSTKLARTMNLPELRTWAATKNGAVRKVTDYKVILRNPR